MAKKKPARNGRPRWKYVGVFSTAYSPDRIQAIIRNETYKKEYAQYKAKPKERHGINITEAIALSGKKFNITLCHDGYKLCKRWKIAFPVNPDSPLKDFQKVFVSPVQYSVFKEKETKEAPTLYQLLPEACWKKITGGRYVSVFIDITAPVTEILESLKVTLSPFKGMHRRRKGTYDPWEIYDLRKEGRTYEEIIKTIDPSPDEDSLLARKDVARKAYKKACRTIGGVTPT